MAAFIHSLFESALKTNPYLEFAVITGCFRISKESIFTGLNNRAIVSVMSAKFDEYFGFTQKEVDVLLEAYGMNQCSDTVKQWYDGYLFGNTEVYNPWSINCFIGEYLADIHAFLVPYWSNTSSNSIVEDLVEKLYHADWMPVHGIRRNRLFFGCKVAAFNVRKLFSYRKGWGHYAQNPLFAE